MYVQIKIPPIPAYISYTPLQKSSALSAKETPCRAPSGTCSPKPCRLQCSARMQTIKPKTSKQTWSTSPSHPKPQPCSHMYVCMYVCIFISYTYIICIYTHVAYMTIITMTKRSTNMRARLRLDIITMKIASAIISTNFSVLISQIPMVGKNQTFRIRLTHESPTS